MLTLTFLGVGSAFAKRNYQSNVLIEAWAGGPDRQRAPDETLLIDFGATGPLALHRLKDRPEFAYLDHNGTINYSAVSRVFVTHVHADHVGGLPELAGVCSYAWKDLPGGRPFKPVLLAADDVLNNLWERTLSGGLAPRRGGYARLEDYFNVQPLRPVDQGGPAAFTILERYTFRIFRTDHIRIHGKYDWPTYGLLITDDPTGETVFYSSDSRLDLDGNGPLMTGAKLIFHDVQLQPAPDPIHALLTELRELPENLRKRTILYHYGDTWDDPQYEYVSREFAGFATPARRYVLFA